MAVLKLERDNERREIEFELDYLASLTTQQRFQMMLQKSREMALLLKRELVPVIVGGLLAAPLVHSLCHP